MAIHKDDLYRMLDSLSKEDKKTAFDFMEFLVERSERQQSNSWKKIDELGSDNDPLTKEEMEQLESEDGYISGEDAGREFGLHVDLP